MQYLVTSARSACLSDSLRKVETFMSRSSFSVGVVPGEIGTRRMKLFQSFRKFLETSLEQPLIDLRSCMVGL